MSQGRKKSWPDRDSNPGPLAIRETTELLRQWSSFDIFPCLIRFVPKSARNNGGTARHAHFDARCPSREPTLATKCHRGGKTRGTTGTRTQGLSLSVRQLSYWANGRPLIFSPCLIRFVPESARNNGGTTRHAPLMLVALAANSHWATKYHRGGKNRGPTGTRTQGLSLSVRQLSYWANGRPLTFSPA